MRGLGKLVCIPSHIVTASDDRVDIAASKYRFRSPLLPRYKTSPFFRTGKVLIT